MCASSSSSCGIGSSLLAEGSSVGTMGVSTSLGSSCFTSSSVAGLKYYIYRIYIIKERQDYKGDMKMSHL